MKVATISPPHEAAADAASPECQICFSSGEDLVFFSDCRHGFCSDCVRAYLSERITAGAVSIECPSSDCAETIQVSAVEQHVDAALFARFQDFIWSRAVDMDPNAKWCPTPGCSGALVRASPLNATVQCHACHESACWECGLRAHERLSCAENRRALIKAGKIDKKTERLLGQKALVKKCPNCAVPIEKNKGCNAMLCAQCQHQWCWICGGALTPEHYSEGPCKGLDGHTTRQKVMIYGTLGVLIVTVPVWLPPGYVGYKIYKRRKAARKKRREEAEKKNRKGKEVQVQDSEEEEDGEWTCEKCSYAENPHEFLACEICGAVRPHEPLPSDADW